MPLHRDILLNTETVLEAVAGGSSRALDCSTSTSIDNSFVTKETLAEAIGFSKSEVPEMVTNMWRDWNKNTTEFGNQALVDLISERDKILRKDLSSELDEVRKRISNLSVDNKPSQSHAA